MEDIFITKIHINKVRHLENLEIPLSETERKHLILTGKNGSGKTSVLEELNKNFRNRAVQLSLLVDYNSKKIQTLFDVDYKQLLLVYLKAKRFLQGQVIQGITKVNFDNLWSQDQHAAYKQQNSASFSAQFIQHIVNLKADRSFARDDNNTQVITEIDQWFRRFEGALQTIYDDPKLALKFESKKYNFKIITKNREEFDFNTLSDGYSAVINILAEIMMRMDSLENKSYDMQGVVLIDEIETHLHISLQKKILPFLTAFFPKIQFIVTTHSPFVLNSISNAVIYDLEKQLRVEDMSGYSANAITEGYFDIDNYSEEIKIKIREYESLIGKTDKNIEDRIRISKLESFFEEIPTFGSPELEFKLQELKLEYALEQA